MSSERNPDGAIRRIQTQTPIAHHMLMSSDDLRLTTRTINGMLNNGRTTLVTTATFSNAVIDFAKEGSYEQAEGYQFQALALQPEETRLVIINGLRKSYAILATLKGRAEEECYARVSNSLAENLSYCGADEKIEAEELFNKSLEVKRKFYDKPGMARTHGGIGRLLLYSDNMTRLDEAEDHFKEDLKISIELGDFSGQAQMNSLLGSCAFKREDYNGAYRCYASSLDSAEKDGNGINVMYAVAGLCDCHEMLSIEDQMEIVTKLKTPSLQDHINSFRVDKIKEQVYNLLEGLTQGDNETNN